MKLRFFLIALTSIFLVSCWQTKSIVPKDIESPFFGNSNAKVQMAIFTDFQCPACIYFEKNIWKKILSDYALTNKIWLTYKNYPLSIHKNAQDDALAVMCGHAQWKYKDFSDKMYALEETKDWLRISADERLKIATEIWLNVTAYNKCIDEWNYVNKIKEDMTLWDKLWLQGTPSVYINWKNVDFRNPDNFFEILDQ
ncbi:MAG: DsbA oxidoreductase, partial [uncultured bacterium (gcode 4)]